MGISVTALRNKLVGGGARPSLFYAKIKLPTTGQLTNVRTNIGISDDNYASFFIKTAQIPESTIASVPINFLGREFKVPSIDRTFADWTVTVINDEDYKIRHLFEAWIEYMAPGKAIFESATGFGATPEIFGDMEVHQLDKKGSVINDTSKYYGSYFFKDAFPINVSAIDLSWDTKDTIEEFSVTFAYQYWEKASGSTVPTSGTGSSTNTIGADNPFGGNLKGWAPSETGSFEGFGGSVG